MARANDRAGGLRVCLSTRDGAEFGPAAKLTNNDYLLLPGCRRASMPPVRLAVQSVGEPYLPQRTSAVAVCSYSASLSSGLLSRPAVLVLQPSITPTDELSPSESQKTGGV